MRFWKLFLHFSSKYTEFPHNGEDSKSLVQLQAIFYTEIIPFMHISDRFRYAYSKSRSHSCTLRATSSKSSEKISSKREKKDVNTSLNFAQLHSILLFSHETLTSEIWYSRDTYDIYFSKDEHNK